MNGREAVTDASECKRMIADPADHVFGLPELAPCDAAPCVECIEPAKPDDVGRHVRGKMPGFVRLSVDEFEARSQGAEFRSGNECEIHLQTVLKQKDAVDPR